MSSVNKNELLEAVEQRLKDLVDRVNDRNAGRTVGSFSHLQHVESLAHALRSLPPDAFMAAGSLLFSKSVQFNALNYSDLALKSADSKELIDARARLYEALAEFITRTDGTGVQDHLAELRQQTIAWLRNENSAKSKLASLRVIQAILHHKDIQLDDNFKPIQLADLFKDRYSYGKASEYYSNGVKGTLLMLLGALCARFSTIFAEKDKPSDKETRARGIRRLCLHALDEQIRGESREPNTTLQAGALAGLRLALEASPCDSSEECDQVYNLIRVFSRVPDDMRRFEVPVQAIVLLRRHAGQLASQICNDYSKLFEDLRLLFTKSERVRNVAISTIREVLHIIAITLSGNDDSEDDDEIRLIELEEIDDFEEQRALDEFSGRSINDPSLRSITKVEFASEKREAMLNFFMKRFFKFIDAIIVNPNETDSEKRRLLRADVDLAVDGLGLFSPAVARLMPNRVKPVIDKLFEASDRLWDAEDTQDVDGGEWARRSAINHKYRRRVRFLSTYARMLGCLPTSTTLDESIVERLVRDISKIAEDMHSFPRVLVRSFAASVSKVFKAVERHGSILQMILQKIMLPLILSSIAPGSSGEEGDALVFVILWRKLFPAESEPRVAESVMVMSQQVVFDHFLAIVLRLITRLELGCDVASRNMQAPETTTSEADDDIEALLGESATATLLVAIENLVPKALDDILMLHHITILLEELLPKVHPSHLIAWLPLYARTVIGGLERNAALSSWFRLMSLAFSTLDDALAKSIVPAVEDRLFLYLSRFLETGCLRSKQYRDELLAASLSCVLRAPRGRLLEEHIPDLVPCMVTALQMGLSFPPMAMDALDQFDRWITVLSASIIEHHYPRLLPMLSNYLSVRPTIDGAQAAQHSSEKDNVTEEDSEDSDEQEDLKRQWQVTQGRSRKSALKSTKRAQSRMVKVLTPEDIGLKAVRILARVGGNVRFLIPPVSEVVPMALKWDPVPRLNVEFALGEFVLEVSLDSIVPRVVYLARSSTDRQTKIAACELLHALVIIMVGSSNEKSKSGGFYEKLYRRLLPELLLLAVDVEPVAQQLFRPLIEQLARWFSRDDPDTHVTIERPETIALLDAAIDALSDKSNGALRELAAKTLGIYFRWTLKSADRATSSGLSAKRSKRTLGSSLNVQAMLHRLYALMRHPEPFKRLGAALAFTEFYRDFREQNAIVDEHVLLLLENGLIMLRMSEIDPEALGTRQASEQVIIRILRIVEAKAVSLEKPSDERHGFESLSSCVEWIFSLCNAVENSLRKIAQHVFTRLAPLAKVHGIPWILKHKDKNKHKHVSNIFDIQGLRVAAALADYELWLLKIMKVPVDDDNRVESLGLFERIFDLVLDQQQNPNAAESHLMTYVGDALCRIMHSIFELVSMKDSNLHILQPKALKAGFAVLLRPYLFGLDHNEKRFLETLPPAMQRFLATISPQARVTVADMLPDSVFHKDIDYTDPNSLPLLRGLTQIVKATCPLTRKSDYLTPSRIVQSVAKLPPGISPQILQNGLSALILSFELGLTWRALVDVILDTSPFASNGISSTESSRTVGETFIEHFQEDVVRRLCLVDYIEDAVQEIFKEVTLNSPMSTSKSSQATRVLQAIVDNVLTRGSFESKTKLATTLLHTLIPSCLSAKVLSQSLVELVGSTFQLFSSLPENATYSESAVQVLSSFMKLRSASDSKQRTLTRKITIIRELLPPLLCGPIMLQKANNELRRTGKPVKTWAGSYPKEVSSVEKLALDVFAQEFMSVYFPLNVTDISSESPEADDYLKALHAALYVLRATCSVALLRLLLRTFRSLDNAHFHRDVIISGIERFVTMVDTSLYDRNSVLPCMDILAECVLSLTREASDIAKQSRMILFESIFVPIASRLTPEAWEVLMTTPLEARNARTIMILLLDVIEHNLESELSKQCAFVALQCIYESAPAETIQSIQRSLFPDKEDGKPSRNINSELSKRATYILSTDAKRVTDEKRDLSSFPRDKPWGGGSPGGAARGQDLVNALSASQRYHNAVYMCLVAVVCRTQQKPSIFEGLLFKKGMVADWWHILIPNRADAATEPAFSVLTPDTPSPTRTRIVMSGILDGVVRTVQRKSQNFSTQISASLAINEEELAERSRAATGDQSTLVTRNMSSVAAPIISSESLSEREVQCVVDESALLDMDAINALPAMRAVLTALDTCRRKRVIQVDSEVSTLPQWAEMIMDALKDMRGSGGDIRQSLNIRLFGAKVILNRPTLFEVYAKHFALPLINLCLDMEAPYAMDPERIRGLHSFLVEAAQLLLVWHSRNKALAFPAHDLNAWHSVSLFTTLLARLSFAPITAVMDANIQLVSAFVEIWKGAELKVQGEPILRLCRSGDPDIHSSRTMATPRSCGLLLLLVLAGHNELPLFPNDISEDDVIEVIFDCLGSKIRAVRLAAAKLLAECLIAKQNQQWLERFHDIVNELQYRDQHEQWLELVASIARHKSSRNRNISCPSHILTRPALERLMGLVVRLEGNFLQMGLDIIAYSATYNLSDMVRASDLLRSIFPLLLAKKVLAVTNPHVGSVLSCLDAITAIVTVDASLFRDIEAWLDSVIELASAHQSSKIRDRAFKLVAFMAGHLVSLGEVSSTKDKIDKLRGALVLGLSDTNVMVQHRIFELWNSDERRMPRSSPLERLVRILQYLRPTLGIESSEVANSLRRAESRWASQASRFLLSLTRLSPEYNNPERSLIFKDPLDASSNFGAPETIDAPDFGGSTSEALIQPLFVSQNKGEVTQHVLASMSASQSLSGELLVRATQQANLQFAPTQALSGSDWASKQHVLSMPGQIHGTMPPPVLRLATQTIPSIAMTHQHASTRMAQTKPERKVLVYRRYRKGELPDIQIPRKDLMEPLISLCALDNLVAQHVLSAVAKAVLDRTQTKKSDTRFFGSLDPAGVLAELINGLESMLREATQVQGQPDAGYVNCILDLVDVISEAVGNSNGATTSAVSARLIGEASLKARSLARGVIALESHILFLRGHHRGLPRSSTQINKRSKQDLASAENLAWTQILALQERLQDEDILVGLAERASALATSRKALQLQLAGEYEKALAHFKEVLQTEAVASSERARAWVGRGKSFAGLRRWDDSFKDLIQLIRERYGSGLGAREDVSADDMESARTVFFNRNDEEVARQLPLFVSSGLRSRKYVQETVHFVEQSALEPSHLATMEATMPLQLVLSALIRREGPDWGQAQMNADAAVQRFLFEFGSHSTLATAARMSLLRPLRPLVECLEVFEARRSTVAKGWSDRRSIESLMVAWERALPSQSLDAIDGPWEETLYVRSLVLRLLEGEATNRNISDANWHEVFSRGHLHRISIFETSFHAALLQARLDEAHAIIDQLSLEAENVTEEALKSKMLETVNSMYVDYAVANERAKDYQSRLERAFDRLKQPTGSDQLLRKSRIASKIALRSASPQHAKEAVDLYQQCIAEYDKMPQRLDVKAECLFELGMFSNKMHLARQSDDVLIRVMVESMLGAIALGHEAAVNAFPSVLSAVAPLADNAEAKKLFRSDAPKKTNANVLLRWTAQLLSFFEQTDLVDPLLETVALTYPQSFYYPFRVAKEAIQEREGVEPAVLARISRLTKACNVSETVHEFCLALEMLTQPEMRLKDALKNITGILSRGEKQGKSTAAVKRAKELFQKQVTEGIFGSTDAKVVGTYNAEFARRHKSSFSPVEWTAGAFQELLKRIPPISKVPDRPSLSMFSGWLDSFASKGWATELEVPGWRDPWQGCYEGEGDRPFALIRSFDSDLLTLRSMRMPKRLSMRGLDGKRKDFLVKGGEDLRLDERIEQLFGFFNALMRREAACARRGLKLETYRVVPISLSVGLIEWVPDTEPVRSAILRQGSRCKSLGETEDFSRWPSFAIGQEFLNRNEPKTKKANPSIVDTYVHLYSVSDDVCAQAYQEMEAATPSDLLRKHFVSLAAGPEAFLALKQVFAQSLSAISMATYVLGIGDRHLENFLLGPSGNLIAIDFGYSFGIGVAMLPVPETLPFRFTPQLRGVFAPSSYHGTFFQCAQAALACMRLHRERVMAVLEVFIREPLMDWIQHANTFGSKKGASGSSSDSLGSLKDDFWRPLVESRVKVANLKMHGVRPSLLMAAELKERPNKSGVESMVSAVCRAGECREQVAKVASLLGQDEVPADVVVPVHEQMEELIKLATSPALLSRQWQAALHWL